jgi:hypothetical protein
MPLLAHSGHGLLRCKCLNIGCRTRTPFDGIAPEGSAKVMIWEIAAEHGGKQNQFKRPQMSAFSAKGPEQSGSPNFILPQFVCVTLCQGKASLPRLRQASCC